MKDKYVELVEKHTPKEDIVKNATVSFLAGGVLGVLSE